MTDIKQTTSHGTNASIEDAKIAGKASDMAEANAGTQTEHDLTIRDALKLYPKAILFSFIFSTSIIMEGYDMSLIGNFYGFTPFKKAYGDQIDPKTGIPVISAPWQAGVKNSMMVGCILGLYLNGILTERFGYKKTLSGSLFFLLGFIFIAFFAQNIVTILVGLTLSGVCWGIFQALSVTYASEVAPTVLRPFLTTYVNLCWVLGQLIALGVLRGFIKNTTQWAYRIPFAIQWFWPIPILIGAYFAPESPWWLVRQERYEDARAALLKLVNTNSGIPYDVDNQLAMIKATNDFEKKVSSGASYLDCFRGTDLRRTEITCIAWLIQSQCGSALMSFSVQFFTSAGLAETNSFNFSLGQYGMGAVGTFMSWFLMTKMGRRSIIIWGLVSLIVSLRALFIAAHNWLTIPQTGLPPHRRRHGLLLQPQHRHRRRLRSHHLHLHLRLHRRPTRVYSRGRNALNTLKEQDSLPRPQRVQLRANCQQHPDAAYGPIRFVELGSSNGSLLGRSGHVTAHLVLLQAAGVQGSYVWRA